MSTELKTLKGQFSNKGVMEDTTMSLTRFSGGEEGMKLQLTMSTQGEFFTHIALNKEEIKILVKELQENFALF
tara:strand:+ start:4446 stop:4664 length:219 start_codon:yes stop_codon:yes gene_type:complete